jgi:hypothetical protein
MNKSTDDKRDRRNFDKTERCAPNGVDEDFDPSPEQNQADPAGSRVAPSSRLPERSEYARTRRAYLWDD